MTISELAKRVPHEAHSGLRMPLWGPVYEVTVEHIEQIMQQGRSRTKTQQGLSRWCQCVSDAAMQMARDGEPPRGARLEMLSEMYYAR